MGHALPLAPRRLPLPNILTAARVVLGLCFFGLLTPGVIWDALDEPARLLIAAGVFVVAAATDALDGFLARRWGQVTRFGRIMDPFADKLLVIGAFVFLAAPGFARVDAAGVAYQATGVGPWIVVIVLGRELLVTSIRAVVEGQGADFSATLSGKLKMVLQCAAVPLVLVLVAFADVTPGTPARGVVLGVAWATAGVTLLSGVTYLRRAVGMIAPARAAPTGSDAR